MLRLHGVAGPGRAGDGEDPAPADGAEAAAEEGGYFGRSGAAAGGWGRAVGRGSGVTEVLAL